MSGNWYGVFDEVREASLEFAASCAEVYAGTVGRCDCGLTGCRACRSQRSARTDCRSGGDFLGDLIRLQVSYVSQLARMSSSYSGLATRAFGSLYGAIAPGRPPQKGGPKHEVLLVGRAGSSASATFTVTNSLEDDEELVVENMKPGYGYAEVALKPIAGGEPVTVRVQLSHESDGKALAGTELEPGECLRGVLSVELPASMGGSYTGNLKLTIGECTRRLRLRVHVRS